MANMSDNLSENGINETCLLCPDIRFGTLDGFVNDGVFLRRRTIDQFVNTNPKDTQQLVLYPLDEPAREHGNHRVDSLAISQRAENQVCSFLPLVRFTQESIQHRSGVSSFRITPIQHFDRNRPCRFDLPTRHISYQS
jgi:hypothetical protein